MITPLNSVVNDYRLRMDMSIHSNEEGRKRLCDLINEIYEIRDINLHLLGGNSLAKENSGALVVELYGAIKKSVDYLSNSNAEKYAVAIKQGNALISDADEIKKQPVLKPFDKWMNNARRNGLAPKPDLI